jgi:Fe2+ or Zn2+ uptake regulation protein
MNWREQYEKENRRMKYVDWLERKLEEKFTSDNSQSTPCRCTGVMHYNAICKSCGNVIKEYSI